MVQIIFAVIMTNLNDQACVTIIAENKFTIISRIHCAAKTLRKERNASYGNTSIYVLGKTKE